MLSLIDATFSRDAAFWSRRDSRRDAFFASATMKLSRSDVDGLGFFAGRRTAGTSPKRSSSSSSIVWFMRALELELRSVVARRDEAARGSTLGDAF